jgi:hypothetical protein
LVIQATRLSQRASMAFLYFALFLEGRLLSTLFYFAFPCSCPPYYSPAMLVSQIRRNIALEAIAVPFLNSIGGSMDVRFWPPHCRYPPCHHHPICAPAPSIRQLQQPCPAAQRHLPVVPIARSNVQTSSGVPQSPHTPFLSTHPSCQAAVPRTERVSMEDAAAAEVSPALCPRSLLKPSLAHTPSADLKKPQASDRRLCFTPHRRGRC